MKPTLTHPTTTLLPPFTLPLPTLCRPCFCKVVWYKGSKADGTEKARRENYESYLHLTFTLPFPTLYLPFSYPRFEADGWYNG